MSGLEPYITRKRHPGRLEGPPPRTPNFRAPTVKTTFGTGPAQGKVEGDVDELESYTSTMRQAAPMVRTENTPPPIAPTAASRGRGRGASRGGRIENLRGRGSFGRGRGVGASRGGSRGSITNFSARGSSVSSRGSHVPNFPPYLPSLPSAGGYRGGSIMSATGGPSSNGRWSQAGTIENGNTDLRPIGHGYPQDDPEPHIITSRSATPLQSYRGSPTHARPIAPSQPRPFTPVQTRSNAAARARSGTADVSQPDTPTHIAFDDPPVTPTHIVFDDHANHASVEPGNTVQDVSHVSRQYRARGAYAAILAKQKTKKSSTNADEKPPAEGIDELSESLPKTQSLEPPSLIRRPITPQHRETRANTYLSSPPYSPTIHSVPIFRDLDAYSPSRPTLDKFDELSDHDGVAQDSTAMDIDELSPFQGLKLTVDDNPAISAVPASRIGSLGLDVEGDEGTAEPQQANEAEIMVDYTDPVRVKTEQQEIDEVEDADEETQPEEDDPLQQSSTLHYLRRLRPDMDPCWSGSAASRKEARRRILSQARAELSAKFRRITRPMWRDDGFAADWTLETGKGQLTFLIASNPIPPTSDADREEYRNRRKVYADAKIAELRTNDPSRDYTLVGGDHLCMVVDWKLREPSEVHPATLSSASESIQPGFSSLKRATSESVERSRKALKTANERIVENELAAVSPHLSSPPIVEAGAEVLIQHQNSANTRQATEAVPSPSSTKHQAARSPGTADDRNVFQIAESVSGSRADLNQAGFQPVGSVRYLDSKKIRTSRPSREVALGDISRWAELDLHKPIDPVYKVPTGTRRSVKKFVASLPLPFIRGSATKSDLEALYDRQVFLAWQPEEGESSAPQGQPGIKMKHQAYDLTIAWYDDRQPADLKISPRSRQNVILAKICPEHYVASMLSLMARYKKNHTYSWSFRRTVVVRLEEGPDGIDRLQVKADIVTHHRLLPYKGSIEELFEQILSGSTQFEPPQIVSGPAIVASLPSARVGLPADQQKETPIPKGIAMNHAPSESLSSSVRSDSPYGPRSDSTMDEVDTSVRATIPKPRTRTETPTRPPPIMEPIVIDSTDDEDSDVSEVDTISTSSSSRPRPAGTRQQRKRTEETFIDDDSDTSETSEAPESSQASDVSEISEASDRTSLILEIATPVDTVDASSLRIEELNAAFEAKLKQQERWRNIKELQTDKAGPAKKLAEIEDEIEQIYDELERLRGTVSIPAQDRPGESDSEASVASIIVASASAPLELTARYKRDLPRAPGDKARFLIAGSSGELFSYSMYAAIHRYSYKTTEPSKSWRYNLEAGLRVIDGCMPTSDTAVLAIERSNSAPLGQQFLLADLKKNSFTMVTGTAHAGNPYSLASIGAIQGGFQFASGGSKDHTVKLWTVRSDTKASASSSTTLHSAHTSCIRSLAYIPSKRWLLSGSTGPQIRIFDCNSSGQRLTTNTLDVGASILHVHPNKQLPDLVAVEAEKTSNQQFLFDLRKGKSPIYCFGYDTSKIEGSMTTSRFSKGSFDGNFFGKGYEDGSVRIWDIRMLRKPAEAESSYYVAKVSSESIKHVLIRKNELNVYTSRSITTATVGRKR